MCGCSPHQAKANQAERDPVGLTMRVDAMTCSHCAGTIKSAIETALPGTSVEADPGSKLVSVRGSTDRDAISAVIADAGYRATLA